MDQQLQHCIFTLGSYFSKGGDQVLPWQETCSSLSERKGMLLVVPIHRLILIQFSLMMLPLS